MSKMTVLFDNDNDHFRTSTEDIIRLTIFDQKHMQIHLRLSSWPPGSFYRPKRSFGQGNIFIGVCHEFCSQGGGCSRFCSNFSGGGAPDFALILGGVPPNFWGGFLQICWGGVFLGVSKFSGGVFFWGGSSKFSGGVFLGGFSKFLGGCLFFGEVSKFSGGGSPPEYGQRSAGTHPTGMHSRLTL